MTVVIDGREQTVELGENVEIVTDPTTGCRGLKFDFGLDKEDGEMRVAFALTDVYPIGPAAVCIKGGQQVLTGKTICGPVCPRECGSCRDAEGHQSVEVCVPVTVTVTAEAGEPEVFCCGEAASFPGECPGDATPSCTFHVTQRLCVAVPLTFDVDAEAGDTKVRCVGSCMED